MPLPTPSAVCAFQLHSIYERIEGSGRGFWWPARLAFTPHLCELFARGSVSGVQLPVLAGCGNYRPLYVQPIVITPPSSV